MTAFELCRQRPHLELAPILRIVKYLGLDGRHLGDADVARIAELYPHFREDPELIVGTEQISARTGIAAATVESLLHRRRREIPYLGTPSRPMVPGVALDMLRAAADAESAADGNGETPAPDDRPDGGGARANRSAITLPEKADPGDGNRSQAARIAELEEQIQAALLQVRSLGRTLSSISRRVRRTREATHDDGASRPRHRRSGGGSPDTIVEACRKVLEAAEEPLKVADITERVLSHGVEIKAKNPNVTVSSILSSYEAFERVRRGYYTLAETFEPE